MPFTSPLETRKIGPEKWRILREFWYLSDSLQILIPEGYESDLASIPKLVRTAVSKVGYWDQATVLHDRLVTHHVDRDLMTWGEAADHLYEACEDLETYYDIPWYRCRKKTIYSAVKAWGLVRG